MKIRLIARQNIIDSQTGKYFNDKGLLALNGIEYGPVQETFDETISDELRVSMIREFEKLFPEFHADRYEVEVVE